MYQPTAKTIEVHRKERPVTTMRMRDISTARVTKRTRNTHTNQTTTLPCLQASLVLFSPALKILTFAPTTKFDDDDDDDDQKCHLNAIFVIFVVCHSSLSRPQASLYWPLLLTGHQLTS